jgi:putative Mg2+ transporter-C (MgtC) family protein
MIPWTEILLRLTLAAIFGSVIGLERERKDWAAGLRTHMMVCLGAALIMLVSMFGFYDILGTSNVVLDPSRVAAQVVSGIGFIGAGTILFLKQGAIRGLTTAAGLWTVAAIGLATGGGMYIAAIITTVLALIILWGIKPIERRFFDRYKDMSLRLVTKDSTKSVEVVNNIFRKNDLEISGFLLTKAHNESIISFKIRGLNASKLSDILKEFQEDPAISEVGWDN